MKRQEEIMGNVIPPALFNQKRKAAKLLTRVFSHKLKQVKDPLKGWKPLPTQCYHFELVVLWRQAHKFHSTSKT